MQKTLLYRLFKVGKVPETALNALQKEGIRVLEEGIAGSVTYRKFRSPGRYFLFKKEGFSGALVATESRLIGFAYKKHILNIGLDDPQLSKLDFCLEDETRLKVSFDAETFHEDWSGTLELRYKTPEARAILDIVEGALGL